MRVVVGTNHLSHLLGRTRDVMVVGLILLTLANVVAVAAVSAELSEPDFSEEVRKDNGRTLKVNGMGSVAPSESADALQGAAEIEQSGDANLQTSEGSLQQASERTSF